jgi:hypothetical protein
MSRADSELAAAYSPGNTVQNWLDYSIDGAGTSAASPGFPASVAGSSTGLQETSEDPQYSSWEQYSLDRPKEGLQKYIQEVSWVL